MIIGAHAIVYSTRPEADRAFFRDVLGMPHVDVGDGWLIFGMPPAEVAVHPSGKNDLHELYLMCDDVTAFVAEMRGRGVSCAPVQALGWGQLTSVALPGGGKLGVYQPRHARPKSMAAGRAAKSPARKPAGRKVVGGAARKAAPGPARKPARKAARNATGGKPGEKR